MRRKLSSNQFGILITLICVYLSISNLYAKEEVLKSLTCKEAILWESARAPYDAQLDFIKVSPDTPEGEADSLRIIFNRSIGFLDKKQNPPQKTSYRQTWRITADSLEKCSVLSNYKIYVDGVYKKDSVAVTKIIYRVYGPMFLKNWDYRVNNVSCGRADDTTYKGYTYFPVAEYLYKWLEGLNYFPKRECSEEDFNLFFNRIYQIGPDSTYTATIDRKNKITAKVSGDRMEVSIIENNKPNVFVISKANKSHASQFKDMFRIFTGEGKNVPYIEIGKNEVVVHNVSGQKYYKVDGTQLLKAARLAQVRMIMEDDDAIDSVILEEIYDYWE